MDTALFFLINRLPHFAWSDRVVLFFANIQQREVGILLLTVLFFAVLLKKHRLWQAVLVLLVAVVLVNQAVGFLKPLMNHPRPNVVLKGVNILGANSSGPSFPSSSAANVSVLLGFVYFMTRKKPALWAGLTLLLGAFRVYQGIHFPSDVLGGWALGVPLAWAASRFLRAAGKWDAGSNGVRKIEDR